MIEIKYNSDAVKEYKFIRTRNEEIIQNIENILGRIKGNIPLNREKGIDSSLIDSSFSEVEAFLSAEIMEEIEKEEPRFKVIEINYEGNDYSSAKLSVTVKGEIIDE